MVGYVRTRGPKCDGCSLPIEWPATYVGNRVYCCEECAEVRACDCPFIGWNDDDGRLPLTSNGSYPGAERQYVQIEHTRAKYFQPPAAAAPVEPGGRVLCPDGRLARVIGALSDKDAGPPTHVALRIPDCWLFGRFPLGGRKVVVPWRRLVTTDERQLSLDMQPDELARLPEYRADSKIVRDVERTFRDEGLRRSFLTTIRVTVLDGIVTLHGHVAHSWLRGCLMETISTVRGVRLVRTELVADDELEVTVAQALARDPRTRPYLIRVKAVQGIVHLTGAADPAVAEEVAAQVPEVRAIAPHVRGSFQTPLLPKIGLRVYVSDGELGRLEQVVIDPRRRRVIALVVAAHVVAVDASTYFQQAIMTVKRLVVPAADVRVATETAMHLSLDYSAAVKLPVYCVGNYIMPDVEWPPPFDYQREQVRFTPNARAVAREGRSDDRAVCIGKVIAHRAGMIPPPRLCLEQLRGLPSCAMTGWWRPA